jgi:transposase-like protein
MLSARDFAPSDKRCVEIIQKLRWKDRVKCVFCASKSVVKRGKDKKGFQRYLCRTCGRSFNDKTKTIFDKSRLELWE